MEPFIADLLAFQPWLDLVLFKPGVVKPEPIVGLNGAKDEAEALERLAPIIVTTYGAMLECVKTNHITSLASQLQTIAKETRSEEIRRMTEECLKSISE